MLCPLLRVTMFKVAQILFLEHLFLKRQVAVANTHISCAWETPVKQLVQVQELMHQIDELIPNDVPLVLGGDMNSLVGSAAYVAAFPILLESCCL